MVKKKLDVGSIQRRVTGEEPSSTEPSQYQESPDYLGRRVEAQNSVVKGKRERRVVYRVDPASCKIRADHDRNYSALTEDNCRDLIEGIKVHGQEIPAIVRQLDQDKDFAYEIIAGARRHWVTTYLGIDLLVEPRDLSDEEAFILSDEENRNRLDISEYERAQKYNRALGVHYKSQVQMAERMGVTKDWLSRYLDLSALSEDIVKAYEDVSDIKVHHSRVLKPLLKEPKTAKLVLAAAKEMHRDRQPGAVVLSRLKNAAQAKTKATKPNTEKFTNHQKETFLVAKEGTKTVTLTLEKDAVVTEQEWLGAMKKLWTAHLKR